MIERIVIENFKSLRKVDLRLGPLNVFVGTNASGKSNFFDALKVLQGIGHGFSIAEIFDGRPKGATSEVWSGIRGGSRNALYKGAGPGDLLRFEVWIRCCGWNFHYAISLDPRSGVVADEEFDAKVGDNEPPVHFSVFKVVERAAGNSLRVRPCWRRDPKAEEPTEVIEFRNGQPVLLQALSHQVFAADGLSEHAIRDAAVALSNIQRIEPQLQNLRAYSSQKLVRRLGDEGENFAGLVKAICDNPETKRAYLGWLRELRPHEVDDVGVLEGALGEPLFMLKEGDRVFPATVLSDGTLRFAALAAAQFQPEMPGLMTIEEIETGIHPSRLRLLIELLRDRAGAGSTQLFVTTHSPVALSWLTPVEHETTFLCHRDEATGESTVRPLSSIRQLPAALEQNTLGDLFTEGWLEEAP